VSSAATGTASRGGTARERLDAAPAVWLLSAAILAVLVVAPLAILLVTAVRAPEGPGFTVANFLEAFGQAIYRGPVGNSLVYAISVGVLSVVLGAPMAWLVTRTDMPGKAVVRTFTTAAFVTPSFLGATAYVILAGPNAGLINVLYRAVTGAEGALFNIFSMAGLIYVTSLYTFPVVFILTSAALSATPADLEEAARIAGAGRLAVMRTITLPLALPAIFGGFILAFLEALVLFGAPAMLAIPARFHVMTTQVWAFFQYPPQVEVAAAYAMPLLLIAVGLLWAQRRLMGRRGYTTVGGRASAAPPVRLGPWRWAGLAACVGVLLLSIGLPYFALLRAALAKAWGLGWSWQILTLRHLR
jgi:iron(III) transport system permease protein